MESGSSFDYFDGHPSSNTVVHAPPAAAADSNSSGGGGNQACAVREQDRYMPIANVIRIMRKVLPAHAKISDDAKETIQECVSEYISFITSEANDRCQREQRKTITAEDVLWAMTKLGFDDYVHPLSVYLHRYRELEGDHRGSIRGEPLQLKRAASIPSPMQQAGAEHSGFYAAPYHLQHAAAHGGGHQHHHHMGVYGAGAGDGVGGYYLQGVYGDPGAGSSQAPAANFEYPYAPYR